MPHKSTAIASFVSKYNRSNCFCSKKPILQNIAALGSKYENASLILDVHAHPIDHGYIASIFGSVPSWSGTLF